MRYVRTILFLLFVTGLVAAQEPSITPDMPVDSATLRQWLHSSDPRLIAWAADFAHRKHDATIIAEMPDWLEHWPMPSAYAVGDWSVMERRALIARPVVAVLDTLIQENAPIPISAINAIAASFPAQAGVLMSRHPLSESRNSLDQWMLWGDPILIRLATMLFAKEPGLSLAHWGHNSEYGFVAGIVADAEVRLVITVASDSALRPLTEPGACGDSEGRLVAPGWPQVYAYELVENDSNANGPLIVDVGGDRIATVRYPENDGGGTCYYPRRLDPYTRHQLISYWLGIKAQDMTWKPEEPFTIRWTTKAAYERQLGKIIESQRQKLGATVDALRQRGVLTGVDAAPKLVVAVECEMKACPLQ